MISPWADYGQRTYTKNGIFTKTKPRHEATHHNRSWIEGCEDKDCTNNNHNNKRRANGGGRVS